MVKIIKYKNRKMYNTRESKYITLSEVAELVNNGVDVVVKNYNNDDLTKEVLTKSLLKGLSLKKYSEFMSGRV